MEFRILGPLEVVDGSRRLVLPRGHGRALLALLALHPGEMVAADRIVDELWGAHPPPTVGTVVQGLVSRLRRVLEPDRARGAPSDVLRTVGQSYLLEVAPEDVDAERFSHLVAGASREPPPTRAALLAQALSLWRGPALADFTYEPFAQRAIAVLEEMRVGALESRIEADLELGRHRDVVAELADLVSVHPFRERLRCLQMVALYRSGRQADALDAYREARTRLRDELGVEPGAQLRDLEAAVLRQDPSLRLLPQQPAAPAKEERWLPQERRQVTALVLELAPAEAADTDPELLAEDASVAMATVTEVLGRHEARVQQVVGDVLVALFGLPQAHEDDPVRAVRAALEVRDVLAEPPGPGSRGPRSVTAGLETGEVVVTGRSGGAGDVPYGQPLSVAFQMQRGARPGEVLVGPVAQTLLRGSVVLLPRDGSAWSASGLLRSVSGRPGSEEPLFGRADELASLQRVYRRTVRTRSPTRCILVGEAGIGKTRLVRELVGSVADEANVATGHCPAYGEGVTFLPLREALLDLGGAGGWRSLATRLGEPDADRIAEVVGLAPGPGNVHAAVAALTRLVLALAVERPLVLVLEDVHWAEPSLLDVVDHLHTAASGPILLLCVGRPELLEDRPTWAADKLVLGPLPGTDVEALVKDRGEVLDDTDLTVVVEAAQGNPLYAEQLVAAKVDGRCESVPPSLRGLLAARLDRLGPGERDLLRCASVIGVQCTVDELGSLLPDEARAPLTRHLVALERRRLLRPLTDGVVAFRHVLLQQAAYRSMVHPDRAALHERYARSLQERPAPPPEVDEVVGYHLEQAVACRRAGREPADPSLAGEAAEHLARAGERALARMDQAAAQKLLSRALPLLPQGHPLRSNVTQSLSEVDLVMGRFAEAQELLLEAARVAVAEGDASTETAALLEHARIQFIVGPDPVPLSDVRRTAEDAAEFFERTGDVAGAGRAVFLLAVVHMRKGEMVEAEAALRSSLERADRAGQPRERMASRWLLAQALCEGPRPADECRALLDSLSLPGIEHPGLMLHAAILAAMRTEYDEARGLVEDARRVILEVQHAPRLMMFAAAARARVELLGGELSEAEHWLRELLTRAQQGGEPDRVAGAAALLGLVLLDQGRPLEEAETLAALGSAAATAEGVASRATLLGLAARLRSVAGDHEEAVSLALQATRHVPAEMPDLRADLCVVLGRVQAAARRTEGARASFARARELYGAKGNLAALRRGDARGAPPPVDQRPAPSASADRTNPATCSGNVATEPGS